MRFLIIIVTRIGDTLMATPAIRAISNTYPDAQIDVLAHPNRAEILWHIPYINSVGAITKKTAFIKSFFYKQHYDYAIVYGFDIQLIKFAIKIADKVIAFRQDDDSLNQKLHKIVERPIFQEKHGVLQLLALPQVVGADTNSLRIEYHATDQEKVLAMQKLKNISNKKPLIGLQIAGFHKRSGCGDWSSENFEKLCKLILQKYPNAGFVILGGEMEQKKTHALALAIGKCAISVAGTLSLRETGAIISLLDLYIGVDTGPTHIASAFDMPLVILFPANSPSYLTGPINRPRTYAIDHPSGLVNDYNLSMDAITVDQVYSKAIEALT